jgi:FtsZ-interacting cell division protein YlmF
MNENNWAFVVAAWLPSLVLLLAVLLAARFFQKARLSENPGKRSSLTRHTVSATGDSNELVIALENAATLNAYDVNASTDPRVHLGAALRFTPLEYRVAAQEIMQHFKDGNVISIDLNNMSRREAARLIDFCSGMTAVSSGWLFRVTDSVIVLTPQT